MPDRPGHTTRYDENKDKQARQRMQDTGMAPPARGELEYPPIVIKSSLYPKTGPEAKRTTKNVEARGKPTYGHVLGTLGAALAEVDKAMASGAEAHGLRSFMNVEDGHACYTEAMLRHVMEELGGEYYDRSGFAHDVLLAANALIRLQLRLKIERENDVPVPSAQAPEGEEDKSID